MSDERRMALAVAYKLVELATEVADSGEDFTDFGAWLEGELIDLAEKALEKTRIIEGPQKP